MLPNLQLHFKTYSSGYDPDQLAAIGAVGVVLLLYSL